MDGLTGGPVRRAAYQTERRSGRRVRVLALSDHLGYPDGRSHGGTTYFTGVFPELAGEGVELTACFMGARHPAAWRLEGRGVRTVFLGRHKYDPRVFGDIKKIIREEGIQVLHLASYKSHFVGRLLAPGSGVKTVVHFHDSVKMPLPVRLMQLSVAHLTDRAIAASQHIVDYALKEYGLRPDIIDVLNNAIDTEKFMRPRPGSRESFRGRFGLSSGRQIIAVIGRLDEIKGQAHMLRAMKTILDRNNNAVLLLAGDGRERARYEAIAQNLGIAGSVVFAGHVDDIPALLSAVELVAVPSIHREAGPFSAMEAAAAGKPVVCYDIADGSGVVVNGYNGVVVPAGNIQGLAEAVLLLLGDARTYRRMAEAALIHSRNFEIKTHAGKLAEIYRSLLPAC